SSHLVLALFSRRFALCPLLFARLRYYPHGKLADAWSDRAHQAADQTLGPGGGNIYDVIGEQRNVLSSLLFNSTKIRKNLLLGGAAGFLPDHSNLVLFAILAQATGHCDGAAERDWFFQRYGSWPQNVADHIDLIGFRKGDDVAVLKIGI